MRRVLYILIAALMMEGAPWAMDAAAQTKKPRKEKKEKVLTSEGEPNPKDANSNKGKSNDANTPSSYEQRVGFASTRYLFGVAISYADSVTYITDISPINEVAYDMTTKTPIGLDMYSESLRTFLQTQGKTGYVCTTFMCKNKKEAEKQVLALRRKLEKNTVCPYQPLGGFAYQRIATEQIFTNAGEHKNQEEDDNSEF